MMRRSFSTSKPGACNKPSPGVHHAADPVNANSQPVEPAATLGEGQSRGDLQSLGDISAQHELDHRLINHVGNREEPLPL